MWQDAKHIKPPKGEIVKVTDGKRVCLSSWTGNDWEGTCPFIESDEIWGWCHQEEAPILWWTIEERPPKVGETIMAELKGCKLARFKEMTIGEGDNLDRIKQWTFMRPEFNKGY